MGFTYFVYKEISGIYKNDFFNSLVSFAREIDQAIDMNLLIQMNQDDGYFFKDQKIFPFSLKDAFIVVRNEYGRAIAYNRTDKVPNFVKNISEEDFNHLRILGLGSYTIEKLDIKGNGVFYQVNYYSRNRLDQDYLLQILVSSSYLNEDNLRILGKLSLWFPLLIGFILIATFLLFYFSLLPVERLNRELEQIKMSDFSSDLLVGKGLPHVLERFMRNINNLIDKLNRNIKNQEMFIAYASHQIKTPITIINGLSYRLKNILEKKGISETPEVQDIINSSKNLDLILDKLMELTSLDNKKMAKEDTDILDLVTSIIDEYEVLIGQKKLRVDLQANIESDFIVRTEKELLKMMLSNLIHNAIKYSLSEKSIKISLKKEGNLYFFEIRNSSKYLTGDDLEKLKEAFYRSRNSQGIEGAGLGLSIVDRISVLLGIKYKLTSEESEFISHVWIKNS